MKIKIEVDVPQNCEKCIFSHYTEGCYSSYCKLNGRDFDTEELFMPVCPSWCPLFEEHRVINVNKSTIDIFLEFLHKTRGSKNLVETIKLIKEAVTKLNQL